MLLKARYDAAGDVKQKAAPLLNDAEQLYVDLADADATASRAFLEGGLEPAATHARFEGDVAAAGEILAAIGKDAGSSADAKSSVRAITRDLPQYTNRVATARANNRIGSPVGAAYLRDASELLRNEMLPATAALVRAASKQLDHDYRRGTSATIAIAVASIAALLVLGITFLQVFVFRRTNRILNLGLLATTVIVVAASVGTALVVVKSQAQLVRAQQDGSDHAQVLAAARMLGLRAQSMSTLAVIAREPNADVLALADEVGGSDGLIAEETKLLSHSGADTVTPGLHADFTHYRRTLETVQRALTQRDFTTAESVALSTQIDHARALDADIGRAIVSAQAQLDSATTSARRAIPIMLVALALCAIAALVLVAYGLRSRIAEYA